MVESDQTKGDNMIVEEGNQYVLQVLPSWILMARVDRVVQDMCPELTYVVLTDCAWIERCGNHIDLIDAEDPHKVTQLRAHVYPGPRNVRLSAITMADPCRALIARNVRG